MVFDDLKAKAGFGGVELGIHVRKDKFRRGEKLCGEVQIIGGKSRQQIRGIHLYLIREWSTESYGVDMVIPPDKGAGRLGNWGPGGFEFSDAHYELSGDRGEDKILDIILEKSIEILPGDNKKYPFEISLPKKAKEAGASEKWKLRAQADIPLARDAIAEVRIRLSDKK